MDYQKTFDKVYLNILRQGRPAINQKIKKCCLRGDFGTKCAIGWLIPDKNYSPALEHFSVDNLVDQGILSARFTDSAFLYRLQQCHDFACDFNADPEIDSPKGSKKFMTMFKAYMEKLASDYYLTIPQ